MENKPQKLSSKDIDQQYHPAKDRSHSTITLSVIAFFVGFGLILGFYSITIITLYTLLKLLFTLCAIGLLIPRKWYTKKLQLINYEVYIVNILGVGPFLTGLFLVLNFMLPRNTSTTKHEITERLLEQTKEGKVTLYLTLKNNAYNNNPKIIEFDGKSVVDATNHNYLQITTKKGLFGFDVISEKTFVD